MKKIKLLIFLVGNLLLSGCLIVDENKDGVVSIVCLGDSNTMQLNFVNPTVTSTAYRWCEGLGAAMSALSHNFTVANEAYLGMSVTDPSVYAKDSNGNPLNDGGPEQLAAALAGTRPDRYGPPFPPADIVIAAFGTNDVILRLRSNDVIIQGYKDLVAAAPNAVVLIATTPPILSNPTADAQITALNALIRSTFPANQIVDFDTGFRDPTYYSSDGVHLNDKGQKLRAGRAFGAIISNTPFW